MKNRVFLFLFLLFGTACLLFLSGSYKPVLKYTYPILEGTSLENTITVYDTQKNGPCFFVIAGIHGDEEAGWKAALSLTEECPITRGRLFILPVANQYGASKNQRYMKNAEDLNRAFPGKNSESGSGQTAAAIFAEIRQIQPDLVLDLHEALKTTGDGGSGHSIIYTDFDACRSYLLPFIQEGVNVISSSVPFSLTGPAVLGSLNRVVSDELGIPVLTVETFRGLPLKQRIKEQLAITNYFFNFP